LGFLLLFASGFLFEFVVLGMWDLFGAAVLLLPVILPLAVVRITGPVVVTETHVVFHRPFGPVAFRFSEIEWFGVTCGPQSPDGFMMCVRGPGRRRRIYRQSCAIWNPSKAKQLVAVLHGLGLRNRRDLLVEQGKRFRAQWFRGLPPQPRSANSNLRKPVF